MRGRFLPAGRPAARWPPRSLLTSIVGCGAWQGARLYDRGSDALDRGEYAAAIQDLERASRLVPEASEVHNHLGIAYLEEGRTDDARRAFERSVALDCENRAAASNLRALEARDDGAHHER